MEENLSVMINQALPKQDIVVEPVVKDDDGEPVAKVEDDVAFKIVDGELFEVIGKRLRIIANFHLLITSRSILMDEEIITDQLLDLEIHYLSAVGAIRVTAKEFYSGNFMPRVWADVGTGAILYGSKKDLVIATQEMSGNVVPIRQVLTSNGFTADGQYLTPNIRVAAEGVSQLENIELDLSGGNFSKRIGFANASATDIIAVAKHIYQDFLNLKAHDVTYPVIGHVCLSPFSSVISGEMGKKKPALHLEGPSGGGKTMLASMSMSFFGDFQDHFMSWTSTANAIEREGYFFRDSLFLIDDLKASVVAPEIVIRTLQNYVDGHGRARMKSNAGMQKQFYIRGLLLSTGEDFVDNIESINGRTIVINVEPGKNTEAGMRCLENRHLYRSFMPTLIQQVIANSAWKDKFKIFIDKKVVNFHAMTKDLPNGLRISLNWALNYLGFTLFVYAIKKIGVIDDTQAAAMLAEYVEIATRHIHHQASELVQNNPATTMFRILQQKIQANQVAIINLKGTTGKGKVVGMALEAKGLVHLHPDIVMEVMKSHFGKIPFSKNALTKTLAIQGFINRSENGRWTKQVREQIGEQTRINVWEMDLKRFQENCGISSS